MCVSLLLLLLLSNCACQKPYNAMHARMRERDIHTQRERESETDRQREREREKKREREMLPDTGGALGVDAPHIIAQLGSGVWRYVYI